jgi:carboxypeptidase family protein
MEFVWQAGFPSLPHASKWRVGLRLIQRHRRRTCPAGRGPQLGLFARSLSFLLLFPSLFHAQEPISPDNQNAPVSSARVNVHGVVLNAVSGEPLPRALVHFIGGGNSGALTDGDGRFELIDVPTGPQQFEIIKPGFRDEMSEAASAAGGGVGGFAHTVIVAAEMPDMTFRMAPPNSIHGQVQLSTGDVAQGIEMTLLKQNAEGGRLFWQLVTPGAATTKTNAEGAYRFGGLSDGTYVIYSAPAMDNEPFGTLVDPRNAHNIERSGYASQFYPDARDLAGAAKIYLHGGEQVEANLSLALEPFHVVSATTFLPALGASQGFTPERTGGTTFSALLTDSQGHQLPYVAQYDPATRTVQALLPDGTYEFVVTAGRPTMVMRRGGNATTLREDGHFTGAVEFSVAGHAVTNLRIALAIAQSNPVQVNMIRTGSQSRGQSLNLDGGDQVFLTMSQTGGWIGDGMTNTFAVGSYAGPLNTSFAQPGTYWVHTNLPDKHVCEGSLTVGGSNLAREPLTLGISGSSAPVTLNLRDDCASLTLTLPAAAAVSGGGEESSYTVYVVPDFDSTEDVIPHTLRPSTESNVTLEGLTPGSYHVYAFDKPVGLAYHDRATMDALSNAGQAINLAPLANANLVLEVPNR